MSTAIMPQNTMYEFGDNLIKVNKSQFINREQQVPTVKHVLGIEISSCRYSRYYYYHLCVFLRGSLVMILLCFTVKPASTHTNHKCFILKH